jgi:hypothetical protein
MPSNFRDCFVSCDENEFLSLYEIRSLSRIYRSCVPNLLQNRTSVHESR